jgi:hypothetical protein
LWFLFREKSFYIPLKRELLTAKGKKLKRMGLDKMSSIWPQEYLHSIAGTVLPSNDTKASSFARYWSDGKGNQ